MKQLIEILLFTFIISCSNKSKQHSIEGEWRYAEEKNGCVIYFKNGFYNKTKWNDDVVNKSNGKYFFNENQERRKITVSLVPDLQFIEGDTILLPCENIDIRSITDSFLITEKPTQWVRSIEGTSTRRKVIEVYKKINQ